MIENGQVIEYMSVRTKPSRQQIAEAEALYWDINAKKASLKKGRIAGWVHKMRSAPIFWRLSSSILMLMLVMVGGLIGGWTLGCLWGHLPC